VARWWLFLPDIRGVAINTIPGLLKSFELRFNRHRFWISRFLTFSMTTGARVNRHIRRQPAQGTGARNVDMTSSALSHVFALATFMVEHGGDALEPRTGRKSIDPFVTTPTV